MQNSHAALGAPPEEWSFDAPGGKYGVYSFESNCSYLMFAGHDIPVPFNFKTTKTIFVALPSLCVVIMLIILIHILGRLTRKTANKPIHTDTAPASTEPGGDVGDDS